MVYLFKLSIRKAEQCVRFVQSQQQRQQNNVIDVALVSLLLTLSRFCMF